MDTRHKVQWSGHVDSVYGRSVSIYREGMRNIYSWVMPWAEGAGRFTATCAVGNCPRSAVWENGRVGGREEDSPRVQILGFSGIVVGVKSYGF